MGEVRKIEQTVKIEIDSKELDAAVKKANQLVGLLKEAQQIASSLADKEELES